jgi:hypothetical protein
MVSVTYDGPDSYAMLVISPSDHGKASNQQPAVYLSSLATEEEQEFAVAIRAGTGRRGQ